MKSSTVRKFIERLRDVPIALVGLYQGFISPFTPPACRFYPSCSTYARQALKKYGIKANTIQCKAAEINYYLSMHKPDVVVHTTPIPKIDVPAFPGHAFLTGIGEEELVEKIAKTILGEEKKD